jgi:hypothetical protein
MTAVQNAKGPASDPALPSHGSNIPHEETKMNDQVNSTGSTATPANRGLRLQLLDIANHVDRMEDLLNTLEMATNAIGDRRQRSAMATTCDVLMAHFEDLKGFIEDARGEQP